MKTIRIIGGILLALLTMPLWLPIIVWEVSHDDGQWGEM